MIKAKAKHIIWISDRDKITDFQDGVISELVRIGYSSLLNKRASDNEVYGFGVVRNIIKKFLMS